MRSAKSLIPILISILLILTGCEFDPDYIPYQSIINRPLIAGTYEAVFQVNSYRGILYTLELGQGVDSLYDEAPAKLSLYQIQGNEVNTQPYATYVGTCTYDGTYEYDLVTGWDEYMPVYYFDFPNDVYDGWLMIQYNIDTAYIEEGSTYDRLGLRPCLGTITYMYAYPNAWYDDRTPSFINAAPFVIVDLADYQKSTRGQ